MPLVWNIDIINSSSAQYWHNHFFKLDDGFLLYAVVHALSIVPRKYLITQLKDNSIMTLAKVNNNVPGLLQTWLIELLNEFPGLGG